MNKEENKPINRFLDDPNMVASIAGGICAGREYTIVKNQPISTLAKTVRVTGGFVICFLFARTLSKYLTSNN